MDNGFMGGHVIDYIEIYTPMAKPLAYWHTQALGFDVTAVLDNDGMPGRASYVLASGDIRLVLTSSYPTSGQQSVNGEVAAFISQNYCGLKRIVLRVPSVRQSFERAVKNGAFPVKFPVKVEDENGFIEEASIRLFDHNEIVFIDRQSYHGPFRPGYRQSKPGRADPDRMLLSVDHIAAEVRINESFYWTTYLERTIGTTLAQSIERGGENKTGMVMNINRSFDKKLTLVIAEPESYEKISKVQKNIDMFGPGIHHVAFSTDNMAGTIARLLEKDVEFVGFPDSYYELLKQDEDFKGVDIGTLKQNGILIDKENDGYLMQKFIKPISDRPFFIYEIVQRINGYDGFALKNINMLKRAEELEIIR